MKEETVTMTSKEQELHMAVRNRDTTAVKTLLSKGANINCLFYGWTPLQMAIDIGRQDMALLLIDNGCDVEFHDANNKSPFEEAVIKKQPRVAEAVLKKGVSGDIMLCNGQTPLTFAAQSESLDLVQVLVQAGVDVNKANNQGQTAVYIAAKQGQAAIVSSLVKAGADVNLACRQEDNCTPLIAAAAQDHLQVINYLCKQQDCQLDLQDKDGWTALWHAYSNSNDDICAVLLRAGANKNLPNTDGVSVVQDARDTEDEMMLELFHKYNNMM